MKSLIKYNQNKKAITINDGIKEQNFLINTLLILNIANSVLWIYIKKTEPLFYYLWLTIGLFSLILLFLKLTKISTSKEIKIQDIKDIKTKKVLGNEKIYLLLKNGKKRYILAKNSPEIKKILIGFIENNS